MSGAEADIMQKAEQIAASINAMEDQFERVAANEAAATRSHAIVMNAIESIREISDGKNQAAPGEPAAGAHQTQTASDTMIGLGGGVFVPVVIPPKSKILLDIGSGVALEKDASDTLDYLENRMREIGIVIKNMGAEKMNLANYIKQYRSQLEHITQSMYGGSSIGGQGQSRNV